MSSIVEKVGDFFSRFRKPAPPSHEDWWPDLISDAVSRGVFTSVPEDQTVFLILASQLAKSGDLRMYQKPNGELTLSIKQVGRNRFQQLPSLPTRYPEMFAALKDLSREGIGRKRIFLADDIPTVTFELSSPNNRTVRVQTPALLFPPSS